MILPLLLPLDLPTDGAGHGGHDAGFLEPLLSLGALALVVGLLVLAYVLLRRRGLVPPLSWPARTTAGPETTARQLLAERFARGDLSSEEFMERASVLNWTPGVEPERRRAVGR